MLDAMSAGCIVIGAASPPVAEVIRDEENGLLVDPYSPDELAERILEVLANRSRMEDIGRAARETIVKKYSLDVCLPAQKELIARAIANSQATRFGIPRTEPA
jgi:glycosyltransferase involved in cell wall biosynthesis